MRTNLLLAALLACSGLAFAQTSGQISPRPAPVLPDSLQNQKQPASPGGRRVERIRTEDARATIDETRVGGETQAITVQPTAKLPAYEVLPKDGSRSAAGNAESNAASQGPRVWKFLNF
ncbi:MAG: hypothetical protein V4562_04330 [Pseudomonadota bacterium]